MLILRACEPFGGRLGPASARPSRQPLRGFLRMRFFLMPSRRYLVLRRRTAPSRRTQDVRAAHHLPIHSQALRTGARLEGCTVGASDTGPHMHAMQPSESRAMDARATAAEAASAQRRAALGDLPEWDLSDLYPGRDSAALTRDLATLAADAEA